MVGQVTRDVACEVGKHRDRFPASGINVRQVNGMAVRVCPLMNMNGVVRHTGVLSGPTYHDGSLKKLAA